MYPPQSTESAFVPYEGQACTTYPGESARDTVGVVRPGANNTTFS
ncbi:hypothetical protein AB0L13_22450 [Saccharopolyspora shandongensis]